MSMVEEEAEIGVESGPFDDLIEAASMAFPSENSGEDPRYSDEFLAAKQEIDKLTGTDFEAVERNCSKILTEYAKDLRITGYLTLAMSMRHGVSGLEAALRITLVLIESFWDNCHPIKMAQRRSALEWYSNPRFVALVEKMEPASDIGVANRLLHTLGAINDLMAEKFADQGDAPQWVFLRDWTAKQVKALESRIVPVTTLPQDAKVATELNGSTSAASIPEPAAGVIRMALSESSERHGDVPLPLPSPIESESGLIEAVRALTDFLVEKGERARAASFARALRWGGLKQPPNDGGKTRIPAPRRNSWRAIDEAVQAGDLEGAFAAAESAFFEPGCHLAIDLQLRVYDVARALKDDALILTIETAVAGLLRRIPNMVALRFEDDTPFASGATLSWIESLVGGAGADSTEGGDEAIKKMARKAQELQVEKGLPHALKFIDSTPARTGRERFALELAKADMLLRGNRADIAEALLSSLVERADINGLDEWEPKYSVDARYKLRRVLEQRLGEASDNEKKAIKTRMDELSRAIGRIDATMAATML